MVSEQLMCVCLAPVAIPSQILAPSPHASILNTLDLFRTMNVQESWSALRDAHTMVDFVRCSAGIATRTTDAAQDLQHLLAKCCEQCGCVEGNSALSSIELRRDVIAIRGRLC